MAQVPLLSDEPALSFWLDYAEREGALVEKQRDHALVLLPDPLQQESELPEESTVTASPDVAREDGAILLIAGHPAVERAAASVLAEGDTGCVYLHWPASRPPTRSMLEARARELAPIEQGRIDAASEPIAAYLPLLRAGAMVSYAASLALRFQEQEEAWVDARTGTAPSERMLAALRDRPRVPEPDGRGRKLEPDLQTAIRAAQEQLERRAAARQASLAVHAKRALDAELARADAYYEAALESIARRRATAPLDRARMLEAQAESTQTERTRRRREIEEEYLPRHELRPFRLHLVYLPAYVLAVDIRRGSRAFRSELAWVPAAGEFAAVRCPACGATEPLVVTRERLGCRGCIAPTAAGTGVTPSAPKAVEPPNRPSGAAAAVAEAPASNRSDREPRRGKPSAPAARPRPRQPASGNAERTGTKLAFAFWKCVATGDRWPRQKTPRDSPLRAVYRLYGNAGPLHAIGVAPGHDLEEMSASTCRARAGAPMLAVGQVRAHGASYPYTLSWSFAAGKPVIGEVMPAPHPLALPPLHGETAEIGSRLRGGTPAPTVELDPVGSRLWSTELERSGLPFAVRCLAAWWRIRPRVDSCDSCFTDEALAAAVAGAIARAAGAKRSSDESATIYGAEPLLVALTAHALQPELSLDPRRGW